MASSASRHPQLAKRLADLAPELQGSTAADLDAVLRGQSAHFRQIPTELKAQVESGTLLRVGDSSAADGFWFGASRQVRLRLAGIDQGMQFEACRNQFRPLVEQAMQVFVAFGIE